MTTRKLQCSECDRCSGTFLRFEALSPGFAFLGLVVIAWGIAYHAKYGVGAPLFFVIPGAVPLFAFFGLNVLGAGKIYVCKDLDGHLHHHLKDPRIYAPIPGPNATIIIGKVAETEQPLYASAGCMIMEVRVTGWFRTSKIHGNDTWKIVEAWDGRVVLESHGCSTKIDVSLSRDDEISALFELITSASSLAKFNSAHHEAKRLYAAQLMCETMRFLSSKMEETRATFGNSRHAMVVRKFSDAIAESVWGNKRLATVNDYQAYLDKVWQRVAEEGSGHGSKRESVVQ